MNRNNLSFAYTVRLDVRMLSCNPVAVFFLLTFTHKLPAGWTNFACLAWKFVKE